MDEKKDYNDVSKQAIVDKIVLFRKELKTVKTRVVVEIIGIPGYVFNRLTAKKKLLKNVPKKYWNILHEASNSLFIREGNIEDYRGGSKRTVSIQSLISTKGNFGWINEKKTKVEFEEKEDGKFKIPKNLDGTTLYPATAKEAYDLHGEGSFKKNSSDEKGGTSNGKGVRLSPQGLSELDDRIRRILKEELPRLLKEGLNNVKIEVGLTGTTRTI